MAAKHETTRISIIVPVGARRSDLKSLYAEYKAGIAAIGIPHEFIFVLDGPRTDAARALDDLLKAGEALTVVNLTRSFGEAAALMAGFERSSGNAIVTLPGYHQIDATDLRKLVAALDTTDVAIGYRFPRAGNALDKVRRAAFHGLVRFVTGARFRDLGCGARALRRQVIEELDLYGDQHRFVAILATRLGFRVSEVALRQSVHDRYSRIYRPREYAHQVLDLVSIFFLVRFTKKPLRFFGMLGVITFSLGALLITYLGVDRLVFHHGIADRPVLLLAALLLVLGMQIFALGLLGELIIFTHARSMKDYRVEEVIQYSDSERSSFDDGAEFKSAPARGSDASQSASPAMALSALHAESERWPRIHT
jgi:glycosyltransferase involved in cell wall biosynthesis